MVTIYLLIASLAIISSYKNQTIYTFTLERSKFLKGILPIFIILHHSALLIAIPYYTIDFSKVGSLIVGIFFFISGYGLQHKKQNNSLNYKYIYIHLIKLIVPTIIPAILYWSIYMFFYIDESNWSWNYIWSHNYFILPYSWFVPILLIITLLYYATTYFIKRNFIIIYTLILYVFFYIMKHYNMPIWMFQNLFCFIIGILYQKYELIIFNNSKKKNLLYIGLILIIISYFYKSRGWIDYRSLIATSGIILLFSLCKIPQHSKLINSLYLISYEIYLCHGISFLILSPIMDSNPITYILLSIILTIIIAHLTRKVIKTPLKYILS